MNLIFQNISAGSDLRQPDLHGFTAVAELKLLDLDAEHVPEPRDLHGFTAVAELKRATTRPNWN